MKLRSPLPYVGGKSKLAEKITERIPDHKTYIEVFGGGLWVFFGKERSKYEVINDLDGDLISFYRVLQNHFEEFMKQFKWLLSSREFFLDQKEQLEARGLTDIQKGARYYYLQRQAFGGRVKNRSFGVDPVGLPGINLLRMEEELSSHHLRLCHVTIENLDYKDLIRRYDKPETFFFLDPPYLSAPCYNHNFDNGIEDFKEFLEVVKEIKGKFMFTINDHPAIRELFKEFFLEEVQLTYTVSKGKPTEAKELFITNYESKAKQAMLFD